MVDDQERRMGGAETRGKYVVWQETNSVGNKTLDEQHKRLLDILNRLYDAMSAVAPVRVRALTEELVNYTREHFRDEERMLLRAGYPNLEQHKSIHQTMVAKTNKMHQQFQRNGDDFGDPVVLLQFLREWWLEHINQVDRQYVEYVRDLS
jgi:hemerythrin